MKINCAKYKREIELLDSIPGIDMNQFPTVKHLTSWAGMSPGNNEGAGVKKVEYQRHIGDL